MKQKAQISCRCLRDAETTLIGFVLVIAPSDIKLEERSTSSCSTRNAAVGEAGAYPGQTKSDRKLNAAERRIAVTGIEGQLRSAFFTGYVNDVHVIVFSASSRQGVDDADAALERWLASSGARGPASSRNDRNRKGPAIKGSDAGPQNARAGEAGTGTRSGRKAGDVHRPTNVTSTLDFASSINPYKRIDAHELRLHRPASPRSGMRRMRRDDFSRRLMRETLLTADDLIYPVFVHDGDGRASADRRRCPASSASIDELLHDAEQCAGAAASRRWRCSRSSPPEAKIARRRGRMERRRPGASARCAR